MNDENTSIHDFDFQLICEYFSLVDRQGPGSDANTLQALSFIDNLSEDAQIADLGCGTGAQTMTLARQVSGHITAIDLFPEFIRILNQNALKLGLQNQITGLTASMDQLPFEAASLDLIWSEGAIYNIGFEKGLRYWRDFLKPGGTIAVSEASWFTANRPAEIEDFWMEAYPGIDTIPNKLKQMQDAGYQPIACFTIPENCWINNFYEPQKAAQQQFLQKYPDNKTALNLVANEKREAALYERYKSFYGYAFYIGKK